jgi:hypothetical protein
MQNNGAVAEVAKYLAGGGAAMLFSAAARALPVPDPNGSAVYGFLYRFIQNVMANFDKAQTSKAALAAAKLKKPA